MLEGSEHQYGTDSDGWRAADWTENLHQSVIDVRDVFFESDNGHLHQSTVVVREEVGSFNNHGVTAIVNVVQLSIQVSQDRARQIQDHSSDAPEVAILDDVTQGIENWSLQAASDEGLFVEAIQTSGNAFLEHLIKWCARQVRVLVAGTVEIGDASHTSHNDLWFGIGDGLSEPHDEIVEVIC